MPVARVASRCAWCGASIAEGAERRRRRVLCERCGAWTTDPVPGEDELDRAYGSWYRPSGGRFAGIGDRLLGRLRGRLARRLDLIAPPGAVLDVGAGDGVLVEALQARGRRAVGIERRPSHPQILDRGIDEVGGDWAAVVFWHSLEHLPRAGAALERAASMLEADGVMIVAMPNPASIQAAAFGDRWFALDLPRHLVHVPAASLLARLRGLGLSVERVSHVRGGQAVFGWLYGWVRGLPGHPDLYDAIRRRDARRRPLRTRTRMLALAAAAALYLAALVAALFEAALRRGGSVYVEARRV